MLHLGLVIEILKPCSQLLVLGAVTGPSAVRKGFILLQLEVVRQEALFFFTLSECIFFFDGPLQFY